MASKVLAIASGIAISATLVVSGTSWAADSDDAVACLSTTDAPFATTKRGSDPERIEYEWVPY